MDKAELTEVELRRLCSHRERQARSDLRRNDCVDARWFAGMADEHARELNRRFPSENNKEYQRSVDDLLKEIRGETR